MGFLDCSALLLAVAAYSTYQLSGLDASLTVTVETVGTSTILSTLHLLVMRLLISAVIWAVCLFLLFDNQGLTLDVLQRDGTNKRIHLLRLERFTPFTVWCWVLQLVYFSLASICSAAQVGLIDPVSVPASLAQSAWVAFEVSFATAFLVSAVVSFVLIPGTLKRGLGLDNFFKPLPKVMHNANVVFMALELGVNKLSFSQSHHAYVLIFAMLYVVFAWLWYEIKGVFYYSFLDYARPGAAAWYLGLMAALLLFFACGLTAAASLEQEGQGRYLALGALSLVTYAVLRVSP